MSRWHVASWSRVLPKANVVKRDSFHYKWSKNHKPVLHINPGDKVTLEVNEVTSWQMTENSSADDIIRLDPSKGYPLTGPVYVEGARPGDALVVNVVSVKVADWGWTAIVPGLGLLEEFKEPFLWIWRLGKRYAAFKNGIRIPIRPFCGAMGVAPPEDGFLEVTAPGKHGGNMDTKHLTAGSRLMLPVGVEGALFSVADMHAAQGDGEICVTAIECPGEVTLVFDVVKDARIDAPRYFARGEKCPRYGYYVTTGISTDLMDASKQAARHMIGYLTKQYSLSREEAYLLCSVAGDLRIHEIVDKPNWVVGMMIPQDIFPQS
jgi:acetamidase/formamidase